jgi:hypothetical protein
VVGYYVGSRPQTSSLSVQSTSLASQNLAAQKKNAGAQKFYVRPRLGKFDTLQQLAAPSTMLSTLALNSGYHGFMLAGGRFTTLDVPIAVDTFPMASNALGVIVGHYSDEFGYGHGFIAQR